MSNMQICKIPGSSNDTIMYSLIQIFKIHSYNIHIKFHCVLIKGVYRSVYIALVLVRCAVLCGSYEHRDWTSIYVGQLFHWILTRTFMLPLFCILPAHTRVPRPSLLSSGERREGRGGHQHQSNIRSYYIWDGYVYTSSHSKLNLNYKL